MAQDARPSIKTLPRYVGYEEIRQNLFPGDTIETVRRRFQREMRMGRFPQPIPSGSRANTFDLDEVLAWHERNKAGLVRSAATKPDDLKPEQLADAAVDLLTRAVEHELGQPIDPRGLRVSYAPLSPEVTEEQLADAEASEAALLQQRFAGLDATRSTIVAAWLFPELREIFAAGTADIRARATYLDPHKLGKLARQALSDEAWAATNAKLDALPPKQGH
jgi:hypothetical protein